MKRLLTILSLLLAVACSNLYEDRSSSVLDDINQVFYASITDDTRTYLNDDIQFRWTSKDQISIFKGNAQNKPYEFMGETGASSGNFQYVNGGSATVGESVPTNYAVYPYNQSTSIDNSGVISYYWPDTQFYAENSVGLGANVMVAATKSVSDYNLYFKNVGSYLCISLYGVQQGVSSIELTSLAGETLVGASLISIGDDSIPTCQMSGDKNQITLDCNGVVIVGATKNKPTSFWFVLPPTTLTQGFKVAVNGVDGTQEFVVNESVDFKRNVYTTMTRELTDVVVPVSYYGADHIKANINSETRTYLDANGTTTYWVAGDEIGVYTSEGSKNLKFVTPSAADAWSGNFRGNLNDEQPLYAYYPYNDDAGYDVKAVKHYLEPEQVADCFGLYDLKASYEVVSNSDGDTDINFRSILSLITMRVNGVESPIANYTLKRANIQVLPLTDDGEKPAVTGDLTFDLTNNNTTTFSSNCYDYVASVLETPITISSGVIELPVLVNPSSIVAGAEFLVTLETVEGPSAVIRRTTSKSFEANKRYTLTLNLADMSSDQISYDIYDEGNPMSTISFTQGDHNPKLIESSLFVGASTSSYYTNSTTASDIVCIYNESEGIWEATIPYLYDFSNLVATFTTVNPNSVVTVNGVEQISGLTPNDFNTEVVYEVTNVVTRSVQQARVRLKNTGLPVVTITGEGGVAPYPKSTDFDDIEGKFTVDINGAVHTAGVRLRGNSTQNMPKKPYAIKLDSKSEVLGMPEHKRWVLLANWLDRTMLRNDVAFYLANATGNWAPHGKSVELVLNGVHVGNYFLCEQIKIDKNRVNIADVGYADLSAQTEDAVAAEMGFLLECDQSADESEIYFRVSSPVGFYVYIKDPGDVAGLGNGKNTTVGYTYIKNYFTQVGTALKNKNWTTVQSLLDYQSFVDHWIMTEITMNQESKHPKSFYMHKDAGGKLKAGPAWDYDWGSFIPQNKISHDGESSNAGVIKDNYTMRYTMWYQYLFNDPTFVSLVKERWAALKSNMYGALMYLDQQAALVAESDVYNHAMWPITGMIVNYDYTRFYGFPNFDEQMSFNDAISTMRNNLSARLSWLDTQISNM